MQASKSAFALVIAGLLGLGCLGLVGCSGGGRSSGSASGNGAVQVAVTDAPFPYPMIAAATVTITEIDIHGPGSNGFVVIDSATHIYDLVQLQRGKTALVTSASVPLAPGPYDQMRLIVSSGTVSLTDGRVFPLTIPSGSSSGIKVFLSPPITVRSGLTTQLVLDFDLSQSFEPVPNSATQASQVTDFHFHPVIRGSAAQDSGAIGGTVTSAGSTHAPIAGATITVANADGSFSQNVQTASDGTFVVGFLPPGSYSVTAQSGNLRPVTVSSVIVTVANQTNVNIQL